MSSHVIFERSRFVVCSTPFTPTPLRFTVRQILIAVAVAAVLMAGAVSLSRRWAAHHREAYKLDQLAAEHSQEAERWAAYARDVEADLAIAKSGRPTSASRGFDGTDPGEPSGTLSLTTGPNDPPEQLESVVLRARSASARCAAAERYRTEAFARKAAW
jgi:hypothetical protein